MPTHLFRCDVDPDLILDAYFDVKDAPSIGQRTDCVCDIDESHKMRRVVSKGVKFAEVKGTGNGPIGRGLEDRAELGRRRRAEWK